MQCSVLRFLHDNIDVIACQVVSYVIKRISWGLSWGLLTLIYGRLKNNVRQKSYILLRFTVYQKTSQNPIRATPTLKATGSTPAGCTKSQKPSCAAVWLCTGRFFIKIYQAIRRSFPNSAFLFFHHIWKAESPRG